MFRNPKLAFQLLFIIVIGAAIRYYVAANTYNSNQSSFSTLAKASLGYNYAKFDILNEFNTWLNGDQLKSRIYDLDKQEIQFDDLYTEISGTNHPPLYYYLMHVLRVQFDETSLTPALIFNALISTITILVVFLLGRITLLSDGRALFLAAIYSTNILTFNATTIMKAYELQILFVTLLLLIVVSGFGKDRLSWFHYLGFFLASTVCLKLHYFSYLFVLGICIIIGVHYLQKDVRRVITYGLFTVASVLLSYFLFPEFITNEILKKLAPWQWIGVAFFMVLVAFAFIKVHTLIAKRLKAIPSENLSFVYAITFSLVLGGIIFLASPRSTIRYILPILPGLFVLVTSLLNHLQKSWKFTFLTIFLIQTGLSIVLVRSAIAGQIGGNSLLENWEAVPVEKTMLRDSVLLVVKLKPDQNGIKTTNEKIRSVLFFLDNRTIALSETVIPDGLIKSPKSTSILFDNRKSRLSKKEKRALTNSLKQMGFKRDQDFLELRCYNYSP